MATAKTKKGEGFFATYFTPMRDLVHGGTKFQKSLMMFGISCLIIAGLTSLPWYIPTIYYYVSGFLNTPFLNEAITTILVVAVYILIELSSSVSVPFGADFVAGIMKIGSTPNKTDWEWVQAFKEKAPGWAALFSFFFGLLQLRITHITGLAVLLFGLGTSAASMYCSWTGNTAVVAEITEKEMPEEHKGKLLLLMDSTKRAEIKKIEKEHNSKIEAATTADAKKKKAIGKEAEKKSKEIIATAIAKGCTWGTRCYKEALAKATKDSLEHLATFVPTATGLAEAKASTLSETLSAYGEAKVGITQTHDSKVTRKERIETSVFLISKYLGVICSILFILSTFVATALKYIDLKGVMEALNGLSSSFTTNFATKRATISDDDDDDATNNATNSGGSGARSDVKIRKSITDYCSKIGAGKMKDTTIAEGLLRYYAEYTEARIAFWTEAETAKGTQGNIKEIAYAKAEKDLIVMYTELTDSGHPVSPDFLNTVAKGYAKFDDYNYND